MTLTVHNQLTLLHDLLDEHVSHKNGNVAEYQQIKRLVQSLTANHQISNDQLIQLLPEIYNYGLQGEIAQSLSDHITDNKDNIETWKQIIQQTNLE